MLNSEGKHKAKRMAKMNNLVQMANSNLQSTSQITIEGILQNPKLVSFKLMKLDMD